LQPAEIWWIIEANVPVEKRADVEALPDLYEMLNEKEAESDE